MAAWEYLIIQNYLPSFDAIEKRLVNLGSQGWELVAVAGDIYYLKRPLISVGTKTGESK